MGNNLPLTIEEVMFLSQFTDENLRDEKDKENDVWTIPFPIGKQN